MSAADTQDFLFQWHLTGRCNLRCVHCYDSGLSGGGQEMTLAELEAVADELAETLGVWSETYGLTFTPEVSLTGGEPLLRPDLFDLIGILSSLGFRTSVLTNGTLVHDQEAERLAGLGVVSVQVSLEGPEAIHDRIRGTGSYSAAASGIRSLAQAGLPVTVNMTLTRLNAPFFEAMPGLCHDLGAVRLGFSRLVPAGRGQGLADAALSRVELTDLYRRIAGLGPSDGVEGADQAKPQAGVELVTSDPLASLLLHPLVEDPPGDSSNHPTSGAAAGSSHGTAQRPAGSLALGGCAAGISGITIMPDGTLMPCRRLDLPIGNLRHDSLREVWATSPVLEALRDRDRYGHRCGSCRLWSVCRGCRAVALAMTGDLLADDPHCFLAG